MQNTLFRARWLAPALLLALTGCGQPAAQERLTAHQAAVDPPQLWQVESLSPTGEPMAILRVCADRTLREGFRRAEAEVNGRPCLPLKDRVERAGLYAVRCDLDGRRFGVTVTTTGDPERDFTVAFALKALDGTGDGARQVRRFRRLGPCPADWGIGDQAKARGPRGVNALAGTWSGG